MLYIAFQFRKRKKCEKIQQNYGIQSLRNEQKLTVRFDDLRHDVRSAVHKILV